MEPKVEGGSAGGDQSASTSSSRGAELGRRQDAGRENKRSERKRAHVDSQRGQTSIVGIAHWADRAVRHTFFCPEPAARTTSGGEHCHRGRFCCARRQQCHPRPTRVGGAGGPRGTRAEIGGGRG